jgi:N-acetylneuraminic acid mutarotase
LQLIAIGSYSDGTTKNVSTNADWTSAATSIATVGQATGIITGVALGSTTITAAIGSVAGSVPLSITANNWFPTGSLATARAYHTATLLPSGKVLVAGGLEFSGSFAPSQVTASAELYDPVSGSWSNTGSLATARLGHTATLLPNGTVLVVGGNATAVDGTPLASAEIYDPVAGTWSPTGSLATARSGHSTVLLKTGNVLVMGGGLASSELYNPATATWSATGSMLLPTYGGTATLLGNGKVLVDGGIDPGDPFPPDQLYDPVAGTWSATGVNVIGNLVGQTATLLPDGMVLVTGGNSGGASPGSSVACGLYDPTTGTWSVTGSLATLRAHHTATLLPNGTVLVAGGVENEYGWLATTAEIYSPTTGTWSPAGTLATPVVYQTMTLLMNGAVLVSGGEAGLPSGAQYIISASTAASQLYR